MLVFVIPLKSLQISKSWVRVSKLFERCIKSVCNQTSNNFRVIVVCHEKPEIEFKHPHITYIEVDFPAPDADDNGSEKRDKVRKIFVGLDYARQLKISHTMNVDADDCVSKHLAEFVEQNPQSNGWFVNKGYLYQDGSKFVYFKRKNFHRCCGTCNIVRYDLLDLPQTAEDCRSMWSKYIAHFEVAKKLAQQKTPIEPLPFAGASYIVGHGDNDSGSNFEKLIPTKGIASDLKRALFNYRPLTSSIRKEFGIYEIP